MNRKIKTLAGWIVVLALVLVLLQVSGGGRRDLPEENFSTFLRHVQDDQIAGVTIRENELTVELKESRAVYTTIGVADEDLVKLLSERGAYVLYEEESQSFLRSWGLILIPLFLILFLFFYIARQAKNPGGIMSLGKSRARRISENDVTFTRVGGLAEAKERFGAIIDFLKAPQRWVRAGVRLPRGVLLVGPPGCGKTLLARAVAGEAGVPFFSVSASEFVEVFVGVGAARVRDMFDQARKEAPSLVFIDELDAIGRRRGSGIGSSHDEREHTLNQLLAALDGFEKNEHVVVMAATNRPDVLDSALLRPGRFDQRIAVEVPDRDGRLEMLVIHTREKPLADDISLEAIADRTPQFSGADLESLANEAALLAVRESGGTDAPVVSMEHFERALARTESGTRVFNRLDAILIESASQVAQPTAEIGVRVTLVDGTVCEGRVVWADGNFLKLSRTEDGGDGAAEIVVTKARIRQVESFAGAEALPSGEVVGDRWAQSVVDTM